MFDEKWLQQKLAEGNVQLADTAHPLVKQDKSPVPSAVKWTQTEIDFAKTVLEPMLERGEIIFWTDQMQLNLLGHTYTADFVAMSPKGEWLIYEIKGSKALGSQGRSSLNVRWTVDQFAATGNVLVFWCKQRKDKTFRMRQVVNTRREHPMLKEG